MVTIKFGTNFAYLIVIGGARNLSDGNRKLFEV